DVTREGVFVGGAHFDGGEGVEDVEFGQVEGGVVVHGAGVAEEDEVEPAAAAFAAGGDAVFAAEALEGFPVFLFRGD
ncbi:MAG: hypothetical protein Q9216_006671, partial [Gyalolechia sp. 2 TL-2023]